MKPIGPLAIAMRHFGTKRTTALVVALILIVLLVVGLVV